MTIGKTNQFPSDLVGMGKFRAGETALLRIDEKMEKNLVVDFRKNAIELAMKIGNVELAEFIIDSFCKSLSQIIENLKPPETENKDLLERKLEKIKDLREKLEHNKELLDEIMEKVKFEIDELKSIDNLKSMQSFESEPISCESTFV